ncbi:MAG: hypothetical protein ACXWLH_02675 [Candidatus Saccharimonadales bacterium]
MACIGEVLEQVETALNEVVVWTKAIFDKICEWLRDIDHDVPAMTSKERTVYHELWGRVQSIYKAGLVVDDEQLQAAVA